MYRPEGWRNSSYDCSVCDTEPEGCPGCGNSAYEAGADAILEGLMECPFPIGHLANAIFLNNLSYDARLIEHEGKKGYLVFIPDEEG